MSNTLLKIVLVFTAILEISIGILMIVKPSFFNEVCGVSVKSLSTSFAVGAISIGLMAMLSFLFVERRDISIPLGVIGIYNLGIGVVQIFYPVNGVPASVPVLFHALIGITFLYFAFYAFQRIKN